MSDELAVLAQTDPFSDENAVPGLTSNQRHGALLEAEGMSRKEIAEAVGVTASAVAGWRNLDKYKQEVSRLKAVKNAELDTFFKRVKLDLLEGSVEAIASLREALTAVTYDRNGNEKPAWPIRIRAAQILLERADVNADDSGEGAGAVAAAQATISVTINSDDANVTKNDEEVIEGHAVPAD